MRAELGILRSKQGVSLIAVLLFMLIATIAATATWKWITSEGKSSESRMLQNEAYQSAIAGIEHTRAWMTFNANEAGALIRQYLYDNNGKRKKETARTPINIDAQVRSFANGSKQTHHVWLMEANTDASTYKLKILSEGISRNGWARHTEVAILNVSGLYQITTDTLTEDKHIPINYDFAYFGGSYDGAGGLTISSAVVNGNWSGNPQNVEGNFIVTGDADLSGNNVAVGPLMCVGGNALLGNQGLEATDVYIGKHVNPLKAHIKGNAYLNGAARQGNTGAILIDGNANINGTLITSQKTGTDYVRIGGNLCMSDTGVVVSKGEESAFQVDGYVWMPGKQNLWYGSVDGSDCLCYRVACTYKQCTCGGAFCKEGSAGAVCEEVVYDGPCGYGDDGVWISCTQKQKNPQPESRRCYQLRVQNRGVACGYNENDEKLLGCSHYNLYTDKDNYDRTFANDPNQNCPTAKCGKFILGSSNESKVYIKAGHPSSEYNSVLMAKVFDEPYDVDGKPRNCETSGFDGKTCNPKYWHTGVKKEDDYRYHPYGKGTDGPANKNGRDAADTVYYMYWMPDDTVDVDFGEYHDSYWSYGGANLWSYFVNKPDGQNVKDYIFTNSYHTNSDQMHNAYVQRPNFDGYYRYLNHTAKTSSAKTTNKITGSPYCKLPDNKTWRPQCGVTPWFVSKGRLYTNMNGSDKPACAESVKNACDEYWIPTKGCDGASYLVKDPLVTAYETFEPYASKGCAASITEYTSDLVSKLNACYEELNTPEKKDDNLYNGFLVVKVRGGTNSTNPPGTLHGKFIVIAEEPLFTSFMDVADDSYVFYYMKRGINTLNDATRKNTFIYSDSAIGTGNQFHLTGSIYVTAASCAGMGKLQGSSLTYDPNVTQVLTDACIICQNDGTPCGCKNTNNGDDPDDPDDPTNEDFDEIDKVTDPYFVSNSQQLGVTIETQYKSTEPAPSSYETLSESYLVLPRITYLCQDAPGKLTDYFSVVSLNGASVKKADANVQCTPSLNATGNLVASEGDTLAQGLYTCTANPTNQATVPFYVWVYGSCANDPEVHFEKEHSTIVKDETIEVMAYVSSLDGLDPLKIYVTANAVSSAWTVVPNPNYNPTINGGKYSFTIPNDEPAGNKLLFTVTATEKVNETLRFTLQRSQGYRLTQPVSTAITMSGVVQVCREPVTESELSDFCSANPDKCPPAEFRSVWPDCPDNDPDLIWVTPHWTHGYTVGAPVNNYWNVMGFDAELTLQEEPGSGCVVIIPTANNSKGPPIPENDYEDSFCLRASGKRAWHSVKLQFTGDVKSGNNPFVNYQPYSGTCEYGGDDTHSCIVPVFEGSLFEVSIDKSNEQNEGFSYWQCEGASCPTSGAVGSENFGNGGFAITDDNTVINIHFGEQDKHCFFDEFRQGDIFCPADKDTMQYCIDDCIRYASNLELCTGAADESGWFKKSKWHLLAGKLVDIEFNQRPSYITAARTAPDTGVKVISTVQAGTHGTLRALVQVPHAKSSEGRSSNRIKHSGFMLRSNEQGDDYLMLNVYENMSGNLEAQVCAGESCLPPQELRDTVYGRPMGLSTSSMVMISATLSGADSLVLYAFQGSYYYGGLYNGPTQYKTFFKLGDNNHAEEIYGYVGFKLADRDFKIYGIGWQSDDFNSECFDGPPMVTCSYAAVAVDGIIEVGKMTQPWVGYSGWFDNKNCSVEYWYYNGDDVQGCVGTESGTKCGTEGFHFLKEGKGQHGYTDDDDKDVKTAKAAMTCGEDLNSRYSWIIAAEQAHCGPFWTGNYTECKSDIANMLGTGVLLGALEKNRAVSLYSTENLRGEDLTFEVLNESEGEVYLEVSLISNNSDWGGLELTSRSVAITGHTREIVKTFNVVDVFTNNTTTGFDPEHVVGVMFSNLSDVSVSVKNISALCKNAIHFTGCSIDQTGESSWMVHVKRDGENMDKVTSVNVTALIDGSPATYLDKTGDCPACYEIAIPDEHFFENKGKTYEFFVKLNAPGYESQLSETESCGSYTPSGITCTANKIADVVSENAWPNFVVKLRNCPSSKCQYNVYMDGHAVASSVTEESGSYNYQYDPTGVATECTDDEGCSHTYTLESIEADKPFSCSGSFKVLKKGSTPAALDLSCSLQDQSDILVNSELSTTGAVDATGCDDGTCTWTIKKLNEVTPVGSGSYGDTPYRFTGASAAGTVSYEFTVKRGSDNTEKSCPKFDVTYVATSSSSSSETSSSATGLSAVCDIDKTEIELGEYFTINVSASGGSGYEQPDECSLEGNGVPSGGNCYHQWNYGRDIVITPSTAGSLQYVYKFKLVQNGDAIGTYQCKWNVTVKEGDPNTIILTTDDKSYTAGSYTLKTGAVGNGIPNQLHCKASTVNYDRTIGNVGSCTIMIPANNDKSYNHGCTLSSHSTYTFVVNADPPSDLTCALSY